ncbi:MAG: thioesterase [Syntrophales bacterium]|jgi:medium-chain acyl-[acyl-carrier-protein] hydrolase|nr:thioesterase [Syntrophales bacterium]MCK9528820.1 thioesterase [Syntrophales bacterium]MDX9921980.1 thioesterase [Syntrophales bacterium]
MPETIFTVNRSIGYSETGPDGRLKVGSAFDFLQDAAADHAVRLGVSAADLMVLNLGWVLRQYHLTVKRHPAHGESIRISTWRHSHRRLYELREYEMEDDSGNRIMHARSSWVLINLQSRKPLRLDRNLHHRENGRAISWAVPSPPHPKRVDREITFPVRRHDLDVNRHANNAVFIQWALDTAPPETADTFFLKEINALFIAEALEGDALTSQAQMTEGGDSLSFLHRIVDIKTGRELSRMQSFWQHRSGF